ncbi:MAG: hypothetical protein LBT26_00245 [Clostridiales Family XIII bacterium]|nr:hypothetical protein [Clostridiales Family XIII bacterium]
MAVLLCVLIIWHWVEKALDAGTVRGTLRLLPFHLLLYVPAAAGFYAAKVSGIYVLTLDREGFWQFFAELVLFQYAVYCALSAAAWLRTVACLPFLFFPPKKRTKP